MLKYTYWNPSPVKATVQAARHRWALFSRRGRFPDFLIAGVQKGGTTSLYSYLIQHPRIASALKKEVHYYDEQFWKGPRWYQGFFARAREGELIGEATPSYFYLPDIPGRVYEDSPSVKVIVLLREPAARAYSHFRMLRRRGIEEVRDFKAAVNADRERTEYELAKREKDANYHSSHLQKFGYLSRGEYARILASWLQYFPIAQILLLRSEDLFADVQRTLDQVFEFLGLDSFRVPDTGNKNRGDSAPMPKDIGFLQEYYESHNSRLQQLVNAPIRW